MEPVRKRYLVKNMKPFSYIMETKANASLKEQFKLSPLAERFFPLTDEEKRYITKEYAGKLIVRAV